MPRFPATIKVRCRSAQSGSKMKLRRARLRKPKNATHIVGVSVSGTSPVPCGDLKKSSSECDTALLRNEGVTRAETITPHR